MPSHDYALELVDVHKSFGDLKVLRGINLALPRGGIYCIIGESGSGKTTCLKIMNGLVRPSNGSVRLDGELFDYTQDISIRRSMGYVVQGSGLFPHMSVLQNISLIGQRSGMSRAQCLKRTTELLGRVNLDPQEVLHKKPGQLSGGQQQRVGIARSLFMQPKVMLMDEPFGALDPNTRKEVQSLFLRLQKEQNLTVVLVTHDLAEAFLMADQILLLNAGKVEQVGPPNRLLLKPASSYVEEFLESHSPGAVLESIYLYSVVNTDLWVSRPAEQGFIARHLTEGEESHLASKTELDQFHRRENQEFVFVEDQQGKFQGISKVGSSMDLQPGLPELKADNHFLDGLNAFIKHQQILPVRNDQGRLIGCFSEEAIRAI